METSRRKGLALVHNIVSKFPPLRDMNTKQRVSRKPYIFAPCIETHSRILAYVPIPSHCGIVGQFVGVLRNRGANIRDHSLRKVDYADYRTNLIKDCHINNLHLPHCQVRELRE